MRRGSAVLVASIATWVWLVGGGALAVSCQGNRYEKWTRRVDAWTPAAGSRPLPFLDRTYSNATAKRLQDGRLFVEGYLADGSSAAEEWNPTTETFSAVSSVPANAIPPGAEAAGCAVTYTPTGHVLLIGITAKNWRSPVRVFDRNWRQIDASPFPIGTLVTAFDLSGGGILVVGNDGKAALLEPGASHWTDLPRPPSFDRALAFAVADDRVALIEGVAPRVWDPRTGSVEPLAGPRVNRNFAATASLADLRVLIAGGEAEVPEVSRTFPLWCAALVVWMCVGLYGGFRVMKRTNASGDGSAADSRRPIVVGMLAGLLGAMTIGAVLAYFAASVMR
jgi:hypothetical protein